MANKQKIEFDMPTRFGDGNEPNVLLKTKGWEHYMDVFGFYSAFDGARGRLVELQKKHFGLYQLSAEYRAHAFEEYFQEGLEVVSREADSTQVKTVANLLLDFWPARVSLHMTKDIRRFYSEAKKQDLPIDIGLNQRELKEMPPEKIIFIPDVMHKPVRQNERHEISTFGQINGIDFDEPEHVERGGLGTLYIPNEWLSAAGGNKPILALCYLLHAGSLVCAHAEGQLLGSDFVSGRVLGGGIYEVQNASGAVKKADLVVADFVRNAYRVDQSQNHNGLNLDKNLYEIVGNYTR